jgi:hypothetical protein
MSVYTSVAGWATACGVTLLATTLPLYVASRACEEAKFLKVCEPVEKVLDLLQRTQYMLMSLYQDTGQNYYTKAAN